jgi:hypothetical protein
VALAAVETDAIAAGPTGLEPMRVPRTSRAAASLPADESASHASLNPLPAP